MSHVSCGGPVGGRFGDGYVVVSGGARGGMGCGMGGRCLEGVVGL